MTEEPLWAIPRDDRAADPSQESAPRQTDRPARSGDPEERREWPFWKAGVLVSSAFAGGAGALGVGFLGIYAGVLGRAGCAASSARCPDGGPGPSWALVSGLVFLLTLLVALLTTKSPRHGFLFVTACVVMVGTPVVFLLQFLSPQRL